MEEARAGGDRSPLNMARRRSDSERRGGEGERAEGGGQEKKTKERPKRAQGRVVWE